MLSHSCSMSEHLSEKESSLERLKKIYSRYSARNEARRRAVYRDTRGREHRSDAAMCGYNFFENALMFSVVIMKWQTTIFFCLYPVHFFYTPGETVIASVMIVEVCSSSFFSSSTTVLATGR